MSLNIYLSMPEQEVEHTCECCGNVSKRIEEDCVYDTNMTHNLGRMADAAGIYDAVWRPDENGYTHAKDILPIVKQGLESLLNNPSFYQQFNATNGWGTYTDFVRIIKEYVTALETYPDATIEVSR